MDQNYLYNLVEGIKGIICVKLFLNLGYWFRRFFTVISIFRSGGPFVQLRKNLCNFGRGH